MTRLLEVVRQKNAKLLCGPWKTNDFKSKMEDAMKTMLEEAQNPHEVAVAQKMNKMVIENLMNFCAHTEDKASDRTAGSSTDIPTPQNPAESGVPAIPLSDGAAQQQPKPEAVAPASGGDTTTSEAELDVMAKVGTLVPRTASQPGTVPSKFFIPNLLNYLNRPMTLQIDKSHRAALAMLIHQHLSTDQEDASEDQDVSEPPPEKPEPVVHGPVHWLDDVE